MTNLDLKIIFLKISMYPNCERRLDEMVVEYILFINLEPAEYGTTSAMSTTLQTFDNN
jgi:hypothetical protein